MENLACLSPEELSYFVKTAELEVLSAVPEMIVLKGEAIFTWVYDYSKEAYCFLWPKDS